MDHVQVIEGLQVTPFHLVQVQCTYIKRVSRCSSVPFAKVCLLLVFWPLNGFKKGDNVKDTNEKLDPRHKVCNYISNIHCYLKDFHEPNQRCILLQKRNKSSHVLTTPQRSQPPKFVMLYLCIMIWRKSHQTCSFSCYIFCGFLLSISRYQFFQQLYLPENILFTKY